MKFLVALALALACAHADVSHVVKGSDYDSGASVLRSEYDVSPDGGFSYTYETSNSIAASARGVLKNVNAENPAQEVTGEFKYVAPDGVPYQVSYVANENGYQPTGDHLPVPPPVPELIQRSLDWIAAHPQPADDKYVQRAQPAQAAKKPFF